MKLSDYKALTFDCYGTLIDWESGIFAALQPLIEACGRAGERDGILQNFARHESAQEAETPAMIYSDLLAVVHRRLAAEWGADVPDAMHERFGASVPAWPAFPDSVEALAYLKQHFRLVILSNVDRTSFAGSNARLRVAFDAIYTAQDVGSYKPSHRNFEYMLAELAKLGIGKQDILHTAQSLFHDHEPARAFGLASAWIDRRHDRVGFGATMPPGSGAGYDVRFDSMLAFVEAHKAER